METGLSCPLGFRPAFDQSYSVRVRIARELTIPVQHPCDPSSSTPRGNIYISVCDYSNIKCRTNANPMTPIRTKLAVIRIQAADWPVICVPRFPAIFNVTRLFLPLRNQIFTISPVSTGMAAT